jgi:hypothetical protein
MTSLLIQILLSSLNIGRALGFSWPSIAMPYTDSTEVRHG